MKDLKVQDLIRQMKPLYDHYGKLLALLQDENYDILTPDELEQKISMARKGIIEKHKEKYPIWLSKDGRWKTRVPDKSYKYGKILTRKDEDSLLEAVIEWYKEEARSNTLSKIYPEWIAYKALETTPANAHKLAWVWKKYYEGDPITERNLKTIKTIEVKKWFLIKIDELQLTRKKYKEVKSVLNSILDYAVEMELVGINASRMVKNIGAKHFAVPEPKNVSDKVYMEDEQAEFLKTCEEFYKESNDTAFLAVAMNLHLGLRVGELVALKEGDFSGMFVHIEREEVANYVEENGEYVRRGLKVANYTKTPESVRDVPLTSKARGYFKEICENNAHNAYDTDFLFVNKHTGERMHNDRINRVLQRVNKKMNTSQKGNHGLRRTYLSTLDAFGNLTDEEIRSVAGHKEITTTQNSYLYSVKRPENRVIEFEKALEKCSVSEGSSAPGNFVTSG